MILFFLFYILFFLAFNSYIFYPLLMFLISIFKKNKEIVEYEPLVSILIAAYNEEKVIKERIENIALQNYDFSKIELLIGSDASSDKTNEILKEFANKYAWLKIFAFDERRGKAGVLNDLVKSASNEILVFTDANTAFENNSIRKLVRHFSKMEIGGVCGKLILTDKNIKKNESVEEAKYWQFETIIKKGEGKLGILLGANGGNFAIRKSLSTYLLPNKPVTDDLFLSLMVLMKGAKFIYEQESIATEDVGESVSVELKRKVRFSATNFQTLALTKNLLFSKNILLSYAYLSHKVIRWFFPFIMLLFFVISISLFHLGHFYKTILIIQILFYVFASMGFVLSKLKIKITPFSLSYFFVASNIALFKGFVKYIKGEHSVIWQSTKRPVP